MPSLPHFITFASDAELMAAWGAIFLVVAGGCSLMERRRMRRTRIDHVGWVPWTGLFVAFAVIGGGSIALATPILLHQ